MAPLAAKNLIKQITAISIIKIVVKIATPPPIGTIRGLYLSDEGRDTKPVLMANILTIAVMQSESAKEPNSNIAATAINFLLLSILFP